MGCCVVKNKLNGGQIKHYQNNKVNKNQVMQMNDNNFDSNEVNENNTQQFKADTQTDTQYQKLQEINQISITNKVKVANYSTTDSLQQNSTIKTNQNKPCFGVVSNQELVNEADEEYLQQQLLSQEEKKQIQLNNQQEPQSQEQSTFFQQKQDRNILNESQLPETKRLQEDINNKNQDPQSIENQDNLQFTQNMIRVQIMKTKSQENLAIDQINKQMKQTQSNIIVINHNQDNDMAKYKINKEDSEFDYQNVDETLFNMQGINQNGQQKSSELDKDFDE